MKIESDSASIVLQQLKIKYSPVQLPLKTVNALFLCPNVLLRGRLVVSLTLYNYALE